jgi:hypothetical protein
MKILITLVTALVLTGTALAQQPPDPKPAVPAAPAPPAPPPPPAPPAPPAPRAAADPINVRYEIAVRDTGGQPVTKTVTMTATQNATSSVRASGTTTGRGTNPLNVDVMPSAIRDNKVLTYIGFEYVPQSPGVAGPPPLSVRQTLHAWLESGKPMLVSQATDPNSERRLEVTVTATVLR